MTQSKTRRGFQKTILALAATFGLALTSQAVEVGWYWNNYQFPMGYVDESQAYIVIFNSSVNLLTQLLASPNRSLADVINANLANVIAAIPPPLSEDDMEGYFSDSCTVDIPSIGTGQQSVTIAVIAPLTDKGKDAKEGEDEFRAWGWVDIFSLYVLDELGVNEDGQIASWLGDYRFGNEDVGGNMEAFYSSFNFKQIPEPATGLLILVGGSLALLRRRR